VASFTSSLLNKHLVRKHRATEKIGSRRFFIAIYDSATRTARLSMRAQPPAFLIFNGKLRTIG